MKKKPDNLSECAAAARMLGMTYGKYMSLYRPDAPARQRSVQQEQTEQIHKKQREPEQKQEKVCPICGRVFYSGGLDNRKIYCSEHCANLKRIERKRQKYAMTKKKKENKA